MRCAPCRAHKKDTAKACRLCRRSLTPLGGGRSPDPTGTVTRVSRLPCDAKACVTYTGRQHACGTLPRELYNWAPRNYAGGFPDSCTLHREKVLPLPFIIVAAAGQFYWTSRGKKVTRSHINYKFRGGSRIASL